MSLVIKFYFTSSMLNMFRTLIHSSSGACDFSIKSPHWMCVLVSMCVGVSVWWGWSGIRVAGWSCASACHMDTTPTNHTETPTHIETRTHNQFSDTIEKSWRVRRISCSLILKMKLVPPISSSVVLCSFVLRVDIVVLVLVFYLCPFSVSVLTTFLGILLFTIFNPLKT